jgi:hypothetical protein
MEIGQWIRRRGRLSHVWHFVESIVADDVVTRCGRRMALEGLYVQNSQPLDGACRAGCHRSFLGQP